MPPRNGSSRRVAKWKRRGDVHSKSYKNPFFQKKVQIFSYFPLRFFIFLLLGINVFLLTHLFFYAHYFKIHEVDVKGVELEMIEIIREKAFEQLASSRWYIFPQKNQFIFDEDKLRETILDLVSYQDIKVEVDKNMLVISLSEEEGILNWSHSSGTYVVNDQGIVLYRVEEFEPKIEYLEEGANKFLISFIIGRDNNPLVYDNTQQKIEIGSAVATSDYISQLLYMDGYFKQQIETTIVSYEIYTTVSSHVKINTYQGWYALINNESNEQIQNDILRLRLLLEEKFKDDRLRAEYVDLRNGEKVFYK